jgi:hypothetical protein
MGISLDAVKAEHSFMTSRKLVQGRFAAAARVGAALLARLALPMLPVLLVLLLAPAARALDLGGGYFGIGDAKGMRVEIDKGAEGQDTAGRFIDSNALAAEFGGGWVGTGIEAMLRFPRRAVFIRITEAPSGIFLIALPFDDEGTPIAEQSRRMVFLRDGVRPPEQPELYQSEPDRADRVVDPDVFLASYGFWSPDGVSRGFAAIGARYRTLIRLFPMVHADVLWKLCQAGGKLASTQRGEALRGQGVDCADIVSTVDRLQRVGRFGEWKAAADADAAQLMVTTQCARGYIVKQSVCGPASKQAAAAAVSMQTVAGAIASFR